MTTTGVVTNVTPRRSGGTLDADVAVGEAVLPLDDAGDFDEEFAVPRFLVVGGESTPREYVAVANDEEAQQSVTLAVAVDGDTALLEAGLPVTLWDPDAASSDKRAISYRAWVRLDGQPATASPVPFDVPHGLVPLGKETTLTGASVEVGDGEILTVYGREPSLSPVTIDSDAVSHADCNLVGTNQSVPGSTWTTIDDSVDAGDGDDLLAGPGNGVVTIVRPGWYSVDVQVNWVSNSTGARKVRIVNYTTTSVSLGFKGDLILSQTTSNAISGSESHMHALEEFKAGDQVRVEVWQNSGGALDLLAQTVAPGTITSPQTRWTIRKAF